MSTSKRELDGQQCPHRRLPAMASLAKPHLSIVKMLMFHYSATVNTIIFAV